MTAPLASGAHHDVLVPAIASPFFLSIRNLATPGRPNPPAQPKPQQAGSLLRGLAALARPNPAPPVVAMVHLTPADGPPLAITDLDEMAGPAAANSPDNSAGLSVAQRFIWVPAAELLITIPADRHRLVLRRLDLREALDRLEIDGLFPDSPGLLTVTAGRPSSIRIGAVSRDRELTFALVRGPDGLTVSPDGTIAWEPPTRLAGQEVPAVIAISGRSGRRVEFTLRIRVR